MIVETKMFCTWVCLLGVFLLNTAFSQPVEVRSLEDLLPYLAQDDVHVVMKPGTYWIRAEDAKAGKFGRDTFQDWCKTLLPFSGSNSTYDFTDVILKVETGVFQSLGSFDIFEIQTTGNNIVIKNLTIEDIGSVYDAPTRGALGIVMDGANNRIEGVHLSTKGSFPYGYGESFGKGGPSVVSGMKKHCGVLVRGQSNHFKDCTIIHRGYGHALFMQAANQPLIEGCYIEGEMVKTDDILAEDGTGTLGDKANFMTYFGYPIPAGYAMCTGEEGIRAYNGGQTWIDGEIINREAQNPTILNCTIKNMRGGVTLTHATGKKYVEGTTAIGCSRGFCIGSGDIVDCYADTQYGPALGVDYEGDSGMNAEITLLPNADERVNGAQYAAFIIGRNHHITLKNKIPNPDQSLIIKIGGDAQHIGSLGKVDNFAARGITLNNQTAHPILVGDRVEDCVIVTGGLVTDLGRNNSVEHVPSVQFEWVNAEPSELAAGEAVECAVGVPLAGKYWLDYQVCTRESGVLAISADGEALENLSVQGDLAGKWKTVRSAAPVSLSGKEHVLQVTSSVDGLTFKGIRFVLEYPATPVVPAIQIYNAMGELIRETDGATVSVYPGCSVVIDPEPKVGGRWSWTGPRGFSSSARTIELNDLSPEMNGEYVATYVNEAAEETHRAINLSVQDLLVIKAEEDRWTYQVEIPYPAMYVFGYRVASSAAGSFSVSMDEASVDQVSFAATGTDGWETVSSGKGIYLKAGLQTLNLSGADNLKLDWIKLKACDLVRSDALPLVYKAGEQKRVDASLIGAIDIREAGPVDVYVMYRNRNSLTTGCQIDGGKSTALNTMPAGSGRTFASAVGLSGTTLKVLAGRGAADYNAIEGIYVLKSTDRFARIEADDYEDKNGTRVELCRDVDEGYNVGSIQKGNWLKFSNLNLTGAKSIQARVANQYPGGSVEVRLNAPDGPVIATIEVPKTGQWQKWETVSAPVQSVTGIFDIYLVFDAESNAAGNMNWFQFSPE
jgi:hypothetical protein